MEDRCAVCGELRTEGTHDHGVLIGVSGDESSGRSGRSAVPIADERAVRNRRWLRVGAGLIAAWLVVVGVGRFTAPDEAAQGPLATPSVASMTAPLTMATAEPTPVPTPGLDRPADAVDAGQLGSRRGADVQLERLVRQLGRRSSEAILAYRAAEGIVLVDLSAGTAEVIEPFEGAASGPEAIAVHIGGDAHPVEFSANDTLLRSNGEVFAIDRTDLRVRLIARDGSLVVAESRSGSLFWVPGQDLQGSAPEVISLTGGTTEWFRSPQTVQLLVADGLGLIGLETTTAGGTLIATAAGFEPLSEHRVLDANAAGRLELVCPGVETCGLQVVSTGGGVWPVPPGFAELADRFVLAPNARAVLRYTPSGYAEIYDVGTESVSWVTGASMNDAAWGPDSSFVAWVDVLGAPELRVMFLDAPDWLSINLSELGIPRPIDSEVVVFSRPVGDGPGSS